MSLSWKGIADAGPKWDTPTGAIASASIQLQSAQVTYTFDAPVRWRATVKMSATRSPGADLTGGVGFVPAEKEDQWTVLPAGQADLERTIESFVGYRGGRVIVSLSASASLRGGRDPWVLQNHHRIEEGALSVDMTMSWEHLYSDLKVESLEVDQATQELTFEFSNLTAPLTNSTSATLYWLHWLGGDPLAPALTAFYSTPIPVGFTGRQHATVALDGFAGAAPPHVRAVVLKLDPENRVNESDEGNNSRPPASLATADLAVEEVRMESTPYEPVLLPGMERRLVVRILNQSAERFTGDVPLRVYLSSDARLQRESDAEAAGPMTVRVDVGPRLSTQVEIPVVLRAGRPNLDRSGARHLIVLLNEDRTIREIDFTNNERASQEFHMGYHVVTAVTHGFNPVPPPVQSWEEFRANWRALARRFQSMPEPGTFFDGRVADPIVAEWDSTTAFLPGFMALIAAKICDAAAANAHRLGEPALEAYYAKASSLLKAVVRRYGANSAKFAEGAAVELVRRLSQPGFLLSNPLLSRGFQHVHLVGHSRGAAVNARVARLLAERGYLVNEYTSLDGYSTDWPDDASLLGDIGIVEETEAAVRRVNYRVEADLVDWVFGLISAPDEESLRRADELFTVFREHFPGPVSVGPADILVDPGTLLELSSFDIRAPERPGFTNFVLTSSPDPSTHLSITKAYLDSNDFIYDNYLGSHRSSRSAPPPPDVPSVWSPGSRGISAVPGRAGLDPEVTSGGFVDGSFEEAAGLRAEALALAARSSGNRFVDAWLAAVADPGGVLRTAWNPEGGVTLTVTDGDAAAELVQAPSAEIRQALILPHAGMAVEFERWVPAAGADDLLEVLWNDVVLERLALGAHPSGQRVRVELGDASGVGWFRIRLAGPVEAPARVRVDDFVLVLPRVRLSAARLADGGLILEAWGPPRATVLLETSEDLRRWNLLQRLPLDNSGQTSIKIPSSADRGFFRLRLEAAASTDD